MALGSNEPCVRGGDSTPPWHEGVPTPKPWARARPDARGHRGRGSLARDPGRHPLFSPAGRRKAAALCPEQHRPPAGAESTSPCHGHSSATPPTSPTSPGSRSSGRHRTLTPPGHGPTPPSPQAPVKQGEGAAGCREPRRGLTSWSWARSPRRMERLARDSTAVIPYRLMSTLATRFKTSCSSTMVWEHSGGDVAPGTPAPQSSPGPTSAPHSTPQTWAETRPTAWLRPEAGAPSLQPQQPRISSQDPGPHGAAPPGLRGPLANWKVPLAGFLHPGFCRAE